MSEMLLRKVVGIRISVIRRSKLHKTIRVLYVSKSIKMQVKNFKTVKSTTCSLISVPRLSRRGPSLVICDVAAPAAAQPGKPVTFPVNVRS